MRILLVGASGFIGRHLARALLPRHQVLWAARSPPSWSDPALHHVPVDLSRDTAADVWLPRIEGVDAVVNAAGLLRESGSQRFEAIHVQAPIALFDACAMRGVRRVVQVSALGADDGDDGVSGKVSAVAEDFEGFSPGIAGDGELDRSAGEDRVS